MVAPRPRFMIHSRTALFRETPGPGQDFLGLSAAAISRLQAIFRINLLPPQPWRPDPLLCPLFVIVAFLSI